MQKEMKEVSQRQAAQRLLWKTESVSRDDRILELDKIVTEVKQSEEWEAVEMNIFEIGVERGKELGIEQGSLKTLIRSVELNMKNFNMDLQEACKGLEISVEEYEKAKQQIARWEEDNAGIRRE